MTIGSLLMLATVVSMLPAGASDRDDCRLSAIAGASDETTVAELRAACDGHEILGASVPGFDLGLMHDSDGRVLDEVSRSWNRVMFRTALTFASLTPGLRAW